MKVEDMEVFIAFLQMIPFYLLLDIVSHSKRYVFIENLKDRIQKNYVHIIGNSRKNDISCNSIDLFISKDNI